LFCERGVFAKGRRGDLRAFAVGEKNLRRVVNRDAGGGWFWLFGKLGRRCFSVP